MDLYNRKKEQLSNVNPNNVSLAVPQVVSQVASRPNSADSIPKKTDAGKSKIARISDLENVQKDINLLKSLVENSGKIIDLQKSIIELKEKHTELTDKHSQLHDRVAGIEDLL